MKETKNLRVEMHPYPHLRDDEGCVLANDYIDKSKIDYIMYCIEREQHSNMEIATSLGSLCGIKS